MTPLEAAAVAYVRAMRKSEPGAITEAWQALTKRADAVERGTPTVTRSLPDARAVTAAALPKPEEVAAMPAHLKRRQIVTGTVPSSYGNGANK